MSASVEWYTGFSVETRTPLVPDFSPHSCVQERNYINNLVIYFNVINTSKH